jgi:hypothetical protein
VLDAGGVEGLDMVGTATVMNVGGLSEVACPFIAISYT